MADPTIIMVAPNGARKTRKDHPNLPVSIEATVIEASASYDAGATILHAHVRADDEQHVLDAGLYKELLDELQLQVPELLVQITTEAVGIYTPQQQIDCVKQVLPTMASVSLKEMTTNFTNIEFARDFYHWSDAENVHIQHILYSAEELEQFMGFKQTGVIPDSHQCVLFVLGRYATEFQSSPDDLKPFLNAKLNDLDWFTCAFGQQEQDCVLAGAKQGGHARIGFENNLYLSNGEIAPDSAALVRSLKSEIVASGGSVASTLQANDILKIQSNDLGT